MTRQEIIDLIHNEYDAVPVHYTASMATEWDDGSGRIADAVLQRIEQLEAALLPAKNTLNAVRILMKNQDRREHEQRVYEAVQICCEAMEDVFTPSSPPEASD